MKFEVSSVNYICFIKLFWPICERHIYTKILRIVMSDSDQFFEFFHCIAVILTAYFHSSMSSKRSDFCDWFFNFGMLVEKSGDRLIFVDRSKS